MNLTDREKEAIKGMIDRGEPLPPKYKLALFADSPEVELVWQGKTSEVTNVVLPFQSIEQVDEPRKEAVENAGLFSLDHATGRQAGGWTNKLIWGENKLVLSSLMNGPMRRAIDEAGGLKLVYIDPPFDVGDDFRTNVTIGDDSVSKEPSVVEELTYRDTWGRGTDSYVQMIYERLRLIHSLMHPDASIYVHCDYRVNSHIRLILDELWGTSALLNEIAWQRTNAHNESGQFGRIHDTIWFYSSSESHTWHPETVGFSDVQLKRYRKDKKGRLFTTQDLTAERSNSSSGKFDWRGTMPTAGRGWGYELSQLEAWWKAGRIATKQDGTPRMDGLIVYLDEKDGQSPQSVWTDVPRIANTSPERLGYSTQKPEGFLQRIVGASSDPGDLVADFFCGSGTTLAVAEKMGRRWIGCDLGRFAIHTTRKRLIGVQRQLKAEGKPFRAFEILNLGKYERQYFVGIDPTLPEEQRRVQTLQREEHYLNLILSAYKGERVFQLPPFHGRKGPTVVVVGPIDAPVTQSQVSEIVAACRKQRITKVDVLGFEFEMGLCPHAQDEARAKGVTLALKYIPKDVFDKRAVEKGQVKFYDVAFVEVKPEVKGQTIRLKLTDFGVYYEQDRTAEIAEDLKPGGSKVTVEGGQVVKVMKDKAGKVTRDTLTKKWTDWIDYWAVDFDYESRKEIVRVVENGDKDKSEREAWTGNYIFENEWQSFRTRKDRTLELISAAHEYARKGVYKVAVKVIDIFGNDTTKVVEVRV